MVEVPDLSGVPVVSRILAAIAVSLSLGTTSSSTVPPGGGPALVVTSPTDPAVRLLARGPVDPSSPEQVDEVVVDPSTPGQAWRGVGAALTDASVDVLTARPDLLPLLFGDGPGGIGLDWVRLPLTATDMSSQTWAWRTTTHGARPTAPARRALTFLRSQVLPLEPDLRVVASAWTAAPQYKSPRTWLGGSLREDAVPAYADVLVGQARWLVRHGVPLAAMTLGNEPGHTADYPTMAISDAALARLASLVGPRLDDLGVELWGLDHNWADVPRVAATGTVGLDAVALHCYEGAPADASQLSVPWLVTECTGTDDTASGTFAWDSRNLVSGAVAAGSTGLIMWNLALPPGYQGVFGGCTTCRGLLTVPAPGAGDVVREPEFFTLAHLRRAAPPGASVVPTSTTGPLLTAGFLAADQVGVYGYNDSDVRRTVRIRTVDGSLSSVHEVGPHEMFSWVAHLS